MRVLTSWVADHPHCRRGALEVSYLAGGRELGMELEVYRLPQSGELLAVWVDSQTGHAIGWTPPGRA